MALTDLAVKSAKARSTTYALRDERNLYLQVAPSGRRYFVVRYWEDGRERKISLGPYPYVTLKDARQRRDEMFMARAAGQPIG
ncbi:MAG: DUF4102 domain-containing protein, partial [Synergistaceae bacterium]|nr:DUF4102 domain-containing protein [Synergistaceae bacterium]